MRSGRAGPGRRFWHTRSGRGNVRPLDDHPARGTLPMYKQQGPRRFPVTEVIRATVGAGWQRPPLPCQPGLVCFPKRTVKACLDFLPAAAVLAEKLRWCRIAASIEVAMGRAHKNSNLGCRRESLDHPAGSSMTSEAYSDS